MGSMSAASNRHSENKPLNCPGRTALLFDYYALSGVFEPAECFISVGRLVSRCHFHTTHTHIFKNLRSISSHASACTVTPAPSLITPHRHLCCGTSRSSTQSLFIFLTHDLWHALWPLRASPGLFPVDPDHSGPAPSLITHQEAQFVQHRAVWPGPLRPLSGEN